jgi:hypothetical protein
MDIIYQIDQVKLMSLSYDSHCQWSEAIYQFTCQ